jgi:1-phosphofructokinase/tagatose 6-phosphate kinase
VVLEAAEADGVRVEPFDGGALTRTCVSIASETSAELTEIYETAVPIPAETFDAVIGRLADVARERPGWWLVSGSTPASLGDDAITRIATTVHAAGARLAVDSHGPALAAAVRAAAPDLVKINRAEAAELTGLPDDAHLTDLVDAVGRRTGGLVVITDGTAGATAGDGRSTVHARLDGHVGLFPVGSGDSFLGGLLVGLEEGDSLGDALRLATAAAVANAQVPGAAVLAPELARELAAHVALR